MTVLRCTVNSLTMLIDCCFPELVKLKNGFKQGVVMNHPRVNSPVLDCLAINCLSAFRDNILILGRAFNANRSKSERGESWSYFVLHISSYPAKTTNLTEMTNCCLLLKKGLVSNSKWFGLVTTFNSKLLLVDAQKKFKLEIHQILLYFSLANLLFTLGILTPEYSVFWMGHNNLVVKWPEIPNLSLYFSSIYFTANTSNTAYLLF